MPRWTLNTTVGEWSAGTEVDILDQPDKETMLVHPHCAALDDSFDVPAKFVTKRRNRTQFINTPTRGELRAFSRGDS